MTAHQRYMSYVKDELYHHGVKGQRWGVRRFQNEDGTLTAAGKKHHKEDSSSIETGMPKDTVGTGGGGSFAYNEDALNKELSDRVLSQIDLTQFGDPDDPEFLSKAVDRLKQVMLSDMRFNDGGTKPHPTKDFIDLVSQHPEKILRGLK